MLSESLADRLVRLEQAWQGAGAPIGRLLAPGVDAAQVRDALAPLGLQPSGELLTWYGWRNGVRPGTPWRYAATHATFTLLSLGQSVERYQFHQAIMRDVVDGERRDPAEAERLREELLPSAWFPLCSADGDSLLADLSAPALDVTPVYWRPRDGDKIVAAGSICDLVGAWLQLLDVGFAEWSPELDYWLEHRERRPAELWRLGT